ncbi:hypothetical protein [Janibacter sp. GS2]|uniref:hypothetical protein n=1 Tax=Janibacter sp. GS2 TaxID=3442646 RepID=UPI003EBFA434
MELITDVERGAWLRDRAGGWARVGGAAGTGFEAYARILHPVPATLEDLSVTDEWGMHPVLQESQWPWSAVARRVGRTMHPLVQWNRVTRDVDDGTSFEDGWRVHQTTEGFFDLGLLATLTGHLADATSTPEDVVAAIWNGWGELGHHGWAYYREEGSGLQGWWAQRRAQREAEAERRVALSPEVERMAKAGPFLEWPARDLVLFATSLPELADPTWPERAGIGVLPGGGDISPQLIWPADHSWVVASEIDWDSTIVAGSRSLVEAVIADETFEAFEVDEDADLTYEGDTINPPWDG